MPPPPALPVDLVETILLCVPPDDPATLLRAALVCKPWCRLISGAAFRRRFRHRNRSPPILGLAYRSGSATYFTPTTPFQPLCAAAGDRFPVDARHGRILFCDTTVSSRPFRIEFVVTDPITAGDLHRLPMPQLLHNCCSWSAAFLCAAAGCDHLDCLPHGPFNVVLVGTDISVQFTTACVYSSEAGAWSETTAIVEHPNAGCIHGVRRLGFDGQLMDSILAVMRRCCALVGDALYFLFERGDRILEYDVVKQELSVISDLPSGCNSCWPALITGEDGKLGLAYVRESYVPDPDRKSDVYMWSREETGHGWEWVHRRTIDLQSLLPTSALSAYRRAVVFANGVELVIWIAHRGVFNIRLESGRVMKVCETMDSFQGIIPYLSFYTPRITLGEASTGDELAGARQT